MPYYRKRRYTARRRPTTRRFARSTRRRFGRRKMGNAKKSISRTIGGFNDRYFTKVKIARTAYFLGDATNLADAVSISLNDPLNMAGLPSVAFTPLGWSQISPVYDNYIVHGSSCRVTFSNLSATVPLRVMVVPIDTEAVTPVSGITTSDTYLRNRLARSNHCSVLTGGKAVTTIKHAVKVSKLAGVSKITSTDDAYTGNTGSAFSSNTYSQPIATYAWVIMAQSVNGTILVLNSVAVDFEITYYIEFFSKLPVY